MRWYCDVTNLIRHISNFRRSMDTKLGKVLTYQEILPPLKLHGSLSGDQGEVTRQFEKFMFSTLSRLMATKLSRALTPGRRFTTQTLKSPSTSCLHYQKLTKHYFYATIPKIAFTYLSWSKKYFWGNPDIARLIFGPKRKTCFLPPFRLDGTTTERKRGYLS